MNIAFNPSSISPKNTIAAKPRANKKKAKIESSIELNTQKNWHTSKMIDTISVIGNNNIVSSTEMYWKAKDNNKKYTPKKYKKNSESNE